MDNAELKEALFNRRPVVHFAGGSDGVEYERVSAIIYRVGDNGKLNVSAELSDKCGHSVSIVDPSRVEYKKEG
jgi:hypothetical protein